MLRFLALVIAITLAGCAGYNARGIDADEDGGELAGIRYYLPAKYLLVYADGQGNVTSETLTMPDLTKKVSIKPFTFMSSNNMTLKFTNGMLDQTFFEVDQTVVPKAVISSLERVAGAAIKAGVFLDPKETGKTAKVPAPYLFKLVNDNGAWKLLGGQALDPNGAPMMIEVKLTKPGGGSQ